MVLSSGLTVHLKHFVRSSRFLTHLRHSCYKDILPTGVTSFWSTLLTKRINFVWESCVNKSRVRGWTSIVLHITFRHWEESDYQRWEQKKRRNSKKNSWLFLWPCCTSNWDWYFKYLNDFKLFNREFEMRWLSIHKGALKTYFSATNEYFCNKRVLYNYVFSL